MMDKDFMEKLQTAKMYVPGGYDMEIDHIDGSWYVYKYSERYGEATPTDLLEPIITNQEAKNRGIDVVKCLDEYGCYYVA